MFIIGPSATFTPCQSFLLIVSLAGQRCEASTHFATVLGSHCLSALADEILVCARTVSTR